MAKETFISRIIKKYMDLIIEALDDSANSIISEITAGSDEISEAASNAGKAKYCIMPTGGPAQAQMIADITPGLFRQ